MRTAQPVARRAAHSMRRAAMVVTLPSALVVTWWFASASSTSFLFPPLSSIVGAFGATWFDGRFAEEVLPSLGRLLTGYSLALVLGIASGLAIGVSRTLRALTEPVLEFFRAIPPSVLVPILMLFLGIGESMKIVVIATGAIWPVLLNTVEGVRGVDAVLQDTARIYHFRPLTRVRTLLLRGASPLIVTGARQALSIAIILMVISEMFAANNGLGFTIIQFQRSFAIVPMWTGIILLGLLGVGMALVLRAVERPLLFWYRGLRQAQRGGK